MTPGHELEDNRNRSLSDGEEEIKKNEEKLADARKEYKEGKKGCQSRRLPTGKKRLRTPDRNLLIWKIRNGTCTTGATLIEHSSFGENAERLGAIGRVFPVLFFLVAALISLTSMTRMVEEQRISIGTMKALGYGKLSIASKYLGYALPGHPGRKRHRRSDRGEKYFRTSSSTPTASCTRICRRFWSHMTGATD